MKKLSLLFVYVCFIQGFNAQNWVLPMDTPLRVVCNFGHLRSNHFHFGIDISTEGVEQKPIYAAADGTISRIVVKRGGYGKALYLKHKNNYTSVYGHCHHFSEALESYINKKLKSLQTSEFDWIISDTSLTFKAGTLIAYSGNTGYSTGPHLHFEIRNSQNESPLNPRLFIRYKDTIRPMLYKISIFDLKKNHTPCLIHSLKVDSLKHPLDTLCISSKNFGIGLDGADWNDFSKKHGLFNVSIEIDDAPVYQHILDQIDFAESEYVKWYTAAFNDAFTQNCFASDVPAPTRFKYFNRGIIHLNDTLVHHLKINVKDESGNLRSYSNLIRYKNLDRKSKLKPLILWDSLQPEISVTGSGPLTFTCPQNVMMLRQNIKIVQGNAISPQFTITAPFPVFNKKVSVLWKNSAFNNLYNHNFYVRGPHTIRPAFRYQHDSLCFFIQEAGVYKVQRDLNAPKISCVYIKEYVKSKSRKKRKKVIRVLKGPCLFKITDDESGVNTFKVFLNGVYTRSYLNRDMTLELTGITWESLAADDYIEIEVTDHCQNTSRQTFYRKGVKIP